MKKAKSCSWGFGPVFQTEHLEIEVWSNLHTEREGSKTDGQSRCQTNARTAGPASCGSWPKKQIELFMYLFMDVLINQPRNAGSSASLTTSFAYGNQIFSHPPSTLDYHSFWVYHSFVSSLTIIWKFTTDFVLRIEGLPASFSPRHFQTIGDTLTLGGIHYIIALGFSCCFKFGFPFFIQKLEPKFFVNPEVGANGKKTVETKQGQASASYETYLQPSFSDCLAFLKQAQQTGESKRGVDSNLWWKLPTCLPQTKTLI